MGREEKTQSERSRLSRNNIWMNIADKLTRLLHGVSGQYPETKVGGTFLSNRCPVCNNPAVNLMATQQ